MVDLPSAQYHFPFFENLKNTLPKGKIRKAIEPIGTGHLDFIL